VYFDVCAMVGVFVRVSFLKDLGPGGKFPSAVGNLLQCAANKLVIVLAVGYCLRHKN
jgi:hypothetical protein